MQDLFHELLQAISKQEVVPTISCLQRLISRMKDYDRDHFIVATKDAIHMILDFLKSTDHADLTYTLIEFVYYWHKKHCSIYSKMHKQRGQLVMFLLNENIISCLMTVVQKAHFTDIAYYEMTCNLISTILALPVLETKLSLGIDEDLYNGFCELCFTKFKNRECTCTGMNTLCMILQLDTSPKLSSFQNEQFVVDYVTPMVAENKGYFHFLRYFATLLYYNIITIVDREGVAGIESMRKQGLLPYLFQFREMTYQSLSPEIDTFIKEHKTICMT